MTPFEMDFWRGQFEEAAARLGWTKEQVTVDHERDGNCSWKEIHWLSRNGSFLFNEDDLSLGMLKEIIRVASLVRES